MVYGTITLVLWKLATFEQRKRRLYLVFILVTSKPHRGFTKNRTTSHRIMNTRWGCIMWL